MKIPDINLLPSSLRTSLAVEHELAVVRQSFFLVIPVFVVSFLVLFGAKILLQQTLQQEQDASAALQKAALAQRGELLDQRIQEFNSSLSNVKAMQEGYVKWTALLAGLAGALPRGTFITSFEANRSSGTFSIKGIALTRNDLLSLQRALADVKAFSEISTPVSSLLERENIPFDLNGKFTSP